MQEKLNISPISARLGLTTSAIDTSTKVNDGEMKKPNSSLLAHHWPFPLANAVQRLTKLPQMQILGKLVSFQMQWSMAGI